MPFNLLDSEWIPVLRRDGRADRVGIRTAFTDAGRIRQIAASNPFAQTVQSLPANGSQ